MTICRPLLLLTLLAAPAAASAQGKISLGVPLNELIKRAVADSNDPAAHYNLALGYWEAKKWPDVDKELKTTLQLDPRFAEAHLAVAYLQVAANQSLLASTDDARKSAREKLEETYTREYRHAFLINPKVDIRIMASVQRSVDDALLRQFGRLYTDFIGGITQCLEGQYNFCEQRLTNVINALGSAGANNDIHWYRGLAAAQLGQYKVAAGDFKLLLDRTEAMVKAAEEKGIVNIPLRTNEYRYFQAAFLHMGGDTTAAERLYQQVLENDLGIYIAHVRLAEIHESRRDYVHALEERRRAIDANPDDQSLLFDLGVTLGKAGQKAESEATLRKAADAMPRNAEVWFWLGLASELNGKSAEARTAYEKVIALAPSRMKARADQARTRMAALK